MLVASWNVNSITVRLEAVLKWLETIKPDVLCLQETKVINDKFPAQAFKQLGYYSEFAGQPTYNGVAILTKQPLMNVEKYVEAAGEQSPKRFIKGEINGSTIINTYVPNGQALGSEKFAYKLEFLEAFKNYLLTKYDPTYPVVWCGDFNIAPEGIDTFNAQLTDGQIMCSETERTILSQIYDWGFIDTFRLHNKETGHYSWWDYREGAFRRNLGYRIDHIWASKALAQICTKALIDKEPRKWERPSDHVPVLAHFDI
jgi:exodeoxyribonuclease III